MLVNGVADGFVEREGEWIGRKAPLKGTKQIELDDAMLEALLDGLVLEAKPASKRRRAVH